MKITEDYWQYKYLPVHNTDEDSYLIETDELDNSIDNNRIWTLVDSDGEWFIIPGKHFVNRLNYIVCEVPRTEEIENEFEVMIEEQYSKQTMINLCKNCIEYLEFNLEAFEKQIDEFFDNAQL